MARQACTLLAGLLASAHAFAPNPPSCADNVATSFNDVVGIAGAIVGIVESCVPDASADPIEGEDLQLECATEIMGLMSNIGATGTDLSGAIFNCGNVETGCPEMIMATVDDFSSFGEDICSAVADCPNGNAGSGIYCASAIIDAVDKAVLVAMDINEAVENCEPEEDDIEPPPAGNGTDGAEIGAPCFIDTDCASGRCELKVCATPILPERRRRRLAALQELEESTRRVGSRVKALQRTARAAVLV